MRACLDRHISQILAPISATDEDVVVNKFEKSLASLRNEIIALKNEAKQEEKTAYDKALQICDQLKVAAAMRVNYIQRLNDNRNRTVPLALVGGIQREQVATVRKTSSGGGDGIFSMFFGEGQTQVSSSEAARQAKAQREAAARAENVDARVRQFENGIFIQWEEKSRNFKRFIQSRYPWISQYDPPGTEISRFVAVMLPQLQG